MRLIVDEDELAEYANIDWVKCSANTDPNVDENLELLVLFTRDQYSRGLW